MNLRNGLKLVLLVITLWLVSTTFQQTFADIININDDLVESALEGSYEDVLVIDDDDETNKEYEDESYVGISADNYDLVDKDNGFTINEYGNINFTITSDIILENLVNEYNDVIIDEYGNIIVPITDGIDTEYLVVNLPLGWNYEFDYDENGDSIIFITIDKEEIEEADEADEIGGSDGHDVTNEAEIFDTDDEETDFMENDEANETYETNDIVGTEEENEVDEIDETDASARFARATCPAGNNVSINTEALLRACITSAPIDGTVRTITLTSGFTLIDVNSINIHGNRRIVLVSNAPAIGPAGNVRTITRNSGNNRHFWISGTGSSLTLGANITLNGTGASDTINARGGIRASSFGTLVMQAGSVITNNRTESTVSLMGGGVQVDNNGIFNMTGGTISANFTIDSHGGGGVGAYAEGTINMSGGVITGNTSTNNGGEVYIQSGSTFNMFGTAQISGNTSTNGSGGVHVWGVRDGVNSTFNNEISQN